MIDVCIPKTLFGNSLEEVTREDLDKLVQRLQEEAEDQYGIFISQDSLFHAEIWYLEYRKNVILPIRYCLFNLLDKIALCSGWRTQDLTKVKYISREGNKGYKVALHTDDYEICFYDKTTAAIFNGTGQDKEIFRSLFKQGFQVLSYEVKLFNKSAITRKLKPHKPLHSFTLQDVCDQGLAQQVLWSHWEEIEKTIPMVRLSTAQLQKSIYQASLNGGSMKDILLKWGVDELERKFGSTRLKHLLVPTGSKMGNKRRENQYAALKKKRQALKSLFKNRKEYIVQKISSYLKEFKPIRYDHQTGDIQGVL